MNLILHRTYFENGTNGALFVNGNLLCFTIELPWKNNRRNISCIPEGDYRLKTRFSKRFQHHLIVENIKNRSYILFHPANDALRDLQGCIAPVTYLTGVGKGIYSKRAMQKLLSLVYQAEDRKEAIQLTISPSLNPLKGRK